MKKLMLIMLAFAATISAKQAIVFSENTEEIADVLAKYMGSSKVSDADLKITKIGGLPNQTVTPVFNNIALTNSGMPSAGYTVQQSGNFYLANALRKILGTAGAAFITVRASNVNLNFNTMSVQGELTANDASLIDCIGVLISSSAVNQTLSNLSVFNGGISQVPGMGIKVVTSSSYPVSGLTLRNLEISYNQDSGIQFTGIDGAESKDLTMENVLCSGGTGAQRSGIAAYGAELIQIIGGKITNCRFNGQTPASGNGLATGLSVVGCSDLVIANCEATANVANGSGNAAGFLFQTTASESIRLIDCAASTNSSTTGKGIGFRASASLSNSTFIDCTANGNATGATTTAAMQAGGFVFDTAASTGNKFRNCEASSNTSSTATASSLVAGFAFNVASCNNNKFYNCLASGNSITGATAASSVYGFFLTGSDNCQLDGCKALSNENQSATGSVYGINITGGNNSNVINNCEASSNVLTSATHTAGNCVGIQLDDNEKLSTISNCLVVGNAGVSSCEDCVIVGIQLGSTSTGVDRCSVIKNTVRSTAVLSSGDNTNTLAGLYDRTTSCNSLIAGNKLILNGFSRLDIGSAPAFNIATTDLTTAGASQKGLNLYLTYSDTAGQNVADIVVETDVSNMQALSTGLEDWTNYLVVPA